jgi:ATP-dependent RNA helicase DeaD
VAITLAEPRERRLLANIEKLTKQRIPVERVPSVADLRARQVDQTVSAVREALGGDDLDEYDEMVATLTAEHDAATVARAALKLLHEATGATTDEPEIPEFVERDDRRSRDRPARGRDRAVAGDGATAFVYVAMGRKGGIRPADLVGAIANESGLSGRDIGPIRITEHSSVVGVPAAALDRVVRAMQGAIVRGKKVTVRPYTETARPSSRR